jgi:hypothetical protein
MGQLSAFVYRDSLANAFAASWGESLYDPSGSVKIAEQLLMASISPGENTTASAPTSCTRASSDLTVKCWVPRPAVPICAGTHQLPKAVCTGMVHYHRPERSERAWRSKRLVGLPHPVCPRLHRNGAWFGRHLIQGHWHILQLKRMLVLVAGRPAYQSKRNYPPCQGHSASGYEKTEGFRAVSIRRVSGFVSFSPSKVDAEFSDQQPDTPRSSSLRPNSKAYDAGTQPKARRLSRSPSSRPTKPWL